MSFEMTNYIYSSPTIVSEIKPRCHFLFLLSHRMGRFPVSHQIETREAHVTTDPTLDTHSCECLIRKHWIAKKLSKFTKSVQLLLRNDAVRSM